MGNKKVPEIRLEGFSGEWDELELGDISEKITEKNKNDIYSETLTNSAEFGIITQRDFFEKDISNKKNLDGYFVVHPNYFVYNPRISNFAPVGPIKRNKLGRTGIMSPLYYVFRTYDVDKTYLEYYFLGNHWHRFMNKNGDSGARSDRFAIKDSVFRQMPIPMPSIKEQKVIGEFFTKIDKKITICQQELDTLKQTKQGFLQKMFPKKGESVPAIRFSGFSGDWENYKISEVGNISAGGDLDKSKLVEDGAFPVLANALTNDGIVGYYNEYKTVAPAVTITGRGDVGKAKARHKNFTATVRLLVLKPYYNFDVDFLELAINNTHIWNESTGVPQLTAPQLASYKLLSPNYEEQTKIGKFFKQLDDTIALHEQELETLKQTKKAFLQKMFV